MDVKVTTIPFRVQDGPRKFAALPSNITKSKDKLIFEFTDNFKSLGWESGPDLGTYEVERKPEAVRTFLNGLREQLKDVVLSKVHMEDVDVKELETNSESDTTIMYPASGTGVLVFKREDYSFHVAEFSNHGEWITKQTNPYYYPWTDIRLGVMDQIIRSHYLNSLNILRLGSTSDTILFSLGRLVTELDFEYGVEMSYFIYDYSDASVTLISVESGDIKETINKPIITEMDILATATKLLGSVEDRLIQNFDDNLIELTCF